MLQESQSYMHAYALGNMVLKVLELNSQIIKQDRAWKGTELQFCLFGMGIKLHLFQH
jgi:hypothetical protein